MQLKERQYQSRFDRRGKVGGRPIPRRPQHEPLDFMRILWKMLPWALGLGVAYYLLDTFVW